MGGCLRKRRSQERKAEIRSTKEEKKKRAGQAATRPSLSESDADEVEGTVEDGAADKVALKSKFQDDPLGPTPTLASAAICLRPEFDPEGDEAIRVEEVEMNRVINDAPLFLALPVNCVWVEIRRVWQNFGPVEMKAEFVGSAFPVDLKYVILPPLKKRRGPTAPKRLFPSPAQDTDGETNEDEEKGTKQRKRPHQKKQQEKEDKSFFKMDNMKGKSLKVSGNKAGIVKRKIQNLRKKKEEKKKKKKKRKSIHDSV